MILEESAGALKNLNESEKLSHGTSKVKGVLGVSRNI